MHYTDEQLSAMLDAAVANLTEDDFEHLEGCDSCRKRLAALSGEGPWLNHWLDSVGDITCDQLVSSGARSVVVSIDASDQMHNELQCDAVRLDFLESPRHPELLGRLGRYDIERLIGMGGYGIVFKAFDTELNRVVAIKVLAPHLMNSGPARKRFAREAQAAAAVVHDHVVPIYDVVADADVSYFVMQYIAGESLQERVDRNGPLATGDILRIASQIAGGLHAAHQQGLIHRDVKPGNILMEESVNRVMISDFGLARAADDASLTRSGTITGTPHYMSPEQARGLAVDARSDLFSLGSVMYFMCTGRSPFRANQMMAVLNRICHEPHRPLEEVCPQAPAEMLDIVDSLLAKEPDKRFNSAEEVQGLLNGLVSDYENGSLRPRRRRKPFAGTGYNLGTIVASLICLAAICIAIFVFRDNVASRDPAGAPPATEASDSSYGGMPRISDGLRLSDDLKHKALTLQYKGIVSAVNDLESSSFPDRVSVFPASDWSAELADVIGSLDAIEEELKSNNQP